MAFLKGLTYRERAEATGRVACFTLLPGSATALRTLPGFERYDESKHCLQCLKPGTGAEDAPRASPSKPGRTTRGFGRRPTSYDEGFETSSNLLAAKHVDDTWPALRTPWTSVPSAQNTPLLRPIQHPELTGADAGAQASKM
eukprot:3981132-Pyramimonas_sp.AAC.1